MSEAYDMCVDYDILCNTEEKLEKIEYDLIHSTNQIVNAIRYSQDFLAGNQFEKAKLTTSNCVEATRKAGINIKHARDYINKLKSALDEYGNCGYGKDIS